MGRGKLNLTRYASVIRQLVNLAEVLRGGDKHQFYAPGYHMVADCGIAPADGPSGVPSGCGFSVYTPGPADSHPPSVQYPWGAGGFNLFGDWYDAGFGLSGWPLAQSWEENPGTVYPGDPPPRYRYWVYPRPEVDPPPAVAPRRGPEYTPSIDPFAEPGPLAPGTRTAPKRYPLTQPGPSDPERAPGERTDAPPYREYPGYGVRVRPGAPGRVPGKVSIPSVRTVVAVQPGPASVPPKAPVTTTPPYVPAPPRPRTKERKFVANLAPGVLQAVVGGATEFADFVDAVWQALPKKYRTKGRRLSAIDKMRDLYNNYDKVDPSEAIKNIFTEGLKDMIYGARGRGQQGASRVLGDWTGRPVGFGTGPIDNNLWLSLR